MNARSTVLLWVRESVTDPLSADVNFSPALTTLVAALQFQKLGTLLSETQQW